MLHASLPAPERIDLVHTLDYIDHLIVLQGWGTYVGRKPRLLSELDFARYCPAKQTDCDSYLWRARLSDHFKRRRLRNHSTDLGFAFFSAFPWPETSAR